MIGFFVRTAVKALVLAAALYVFFFVPLGSRTLYDHLARIAATPEAKELGTDVSNLAEEHVVEPTKSFMASQGQRLRQEVADR